MNLPPPFVRQMRALLGESYEAFAKASAEEAPVSVRLNPHKRWSWANDGVPFVGATPVPWCEEGWYLPERPSFTLDPRLHAGAYYVQEASSMFISEVVRQGVVASQPLRALDMCAAPGGKATLLQAALPGGSLVVANEVVRSRLGALRENLERWGSPYVVMTSAAAEAWEVLGPWFDLVVVDAPCSGEGLFRKNADAVGEWSLAHVEACALRQRAILASAVRVLQPGGLLIYSTCTFNRLENEDNALWLAQTFDLQPLEMVLPDAWGIASAMPGTYRFFPHRLRGEGFFLAAFRWKADEVCGPALRSPSGFRRLQLLPFAQQASVRSWLGGADEWAFFLTPQGEVLAMPEDLLSDLHLLDAAVANKWLGLRMGQFKGRDFVPDHALALSLALSPEVPAVDFSWEEALLFLKKEQFAFQGAHQHRGWVVARFDGLPLGWLKMLAGRWNNYLPPERRIRMAVSPS